MTSFLNTTKPRYRLSKLFFYALVVFLPFNVNKAFFTEYSLSGMEHLFYNSIFLYLTDLLMFGLVLAWLWENYLSFSREKNFGIAMRGRRENFFRLVIEKISNDPVYLFLVAFWLILAISRVFSRENGAGLEILGFTTLARMTSYFLLFAYVRENLTFSPRATFQDQDFSRENYHGKVMRGRRERLNIRLILGIIVISAVFQAGLGIFQYISQTTVGISVLGEEYVRPGIRGVAKIITHGTANPLLYEFFPNLSVISDSPVNMRAYGTFPHPNLLAVFLFAGLMASLLLFYFSPPTTFQKRGFSRENFRITGLMLATLVISTGLVVTFSRLVWAATGLGVFAWVLVAIVRNRSSYRHALATGTWNAESAYFPGKIMLIVLVLLLSGLLNYFVFGTQIRDRLFGADTKNISESESYQDRKEYNEVAFEMIKKNPVFGVGLRNFVVAIDEYSKGMLLPHQHQPVHNIYLLITAEAGVVAGSIFLVILINIVRRGQSSVFRPTLVIMLLVFLGLGLFDHYFVSLNQGSLLFWLTLGMISAK